MSFFLESTKFLLSKNKQMKKIFSVHGVSHLRSEHSEGSSRWTSVNLRPMFSWKDGLVSLCFVPYYNNLLAFHFPSQLQSLLYSEISLPGLEYPVSARFPLLYAWPWTLGTLKFPWSHHFPVIKTSLSLLLSQKAIEKDVSLPGTVGSLGHGWSLLLPSFADLRMEPGSQEWLWMLHSSCPAWAPGTEGSRGHSRRYHNKGSKLKMEIKVECDGTGLQFQLLRNQHLEGHRFKTEQ